LVSYATNLKSLIFGRKLQFTFRLRSKFVTFISNNGESSVTAIRNEEAIAKERMLAGYNMLVTSETNMGERALYNTYHNLWRIEQSFRMMKSFLDARPVYLTGRDSITGHFLLCYIGVVLERILEFKALRNMFSYEDIIGFIQDFRIVRTSSKEYVNLLTLRDEVGNYLGAELYPEILIAKPKNSQIRKLMNARLPKAVF